MLRRLSVDSHHNSSRHSLLPNLTWALLILLVFRFHVRMITTLSTRDIQFSIQYASIALLFYDYSLTFTQEVEYIWKSTFRLSTILYIFSRYALVANVVYLLNISNKLNIHCDYGYKICSVLSVLGRTAIIIAWTARAYAVFDRNPVVLASVGVIGTVCIILSIVRVFGVKCQGSLGVQTVSLLIQVFMCIFESISALFATFRCMQAIRIGGFRRNHGNRFLYLICDQGILYFFTVTLLTVASLILNIRIPGGFIQRLLNALTLPISGLLTARFLLCLRTWEDKGRKRNPGNRSSNLQFTTILQSNIDEFNGNPTTHEERH